jgi:VWFA-related protein
MPAGTLRTTGLLFWLAVRLLGQAPVFRSGTNVVDVAAVVRDHHGQAVGSLVRDDFEIFDDGKRQEITGFQLQTLHRRAHTASALPDRFVAIVIDDQNLVPEHFPLATVAAIRHLADLRAGDRAAVASVSGRTFVEFTADTERLRAGLSAMSPLDRRETYDLSQLDSSIRCRLTYLKADWIRNGDPGSLRNCVPTSSAPVAARGSVSQRPPAGLPSGPDPGERAQIISENVVRGFAEQIAQTGDRDVLQYFATLARLVNLLSRAPGERSIVLLTPGTYIPRRMRPMQDQLIAAAMRAHITINAIDPRGAHLRDDLDDPSTFSDAWGIAETADRNALLGNVTSGTGGAFIRGDNGIDAALRRADGAPEFVYLLAFSPSELKLDGKYHKLLVRLKRRGLAVDARHGYYAAAPAPEAADAARDRMDAAFFSGLDLDALPVTLQVRSSHKPESEIVLTVTAQTNVQKEAVLTLAVGVFDWNGVLVKDSWNELDPLRSAAVDIATDFDVAPGRYMVRVLVSQDAGHSLGTRSMAVTIQP